MPLRTRTMTRSTWRRKPRTASSRRPTGTGVDRPEEIAAVAPRKVRTMVVKPDGSLVPREEIVEEPAPVAEPQPARRGRLPPCSRPDVPRNAAAKWPRCSAPRRSIRARRRRSRPAAVEPVAVVAEQAPPSARKPAVTSDAGHRAGPLAPSRPADQPVDVVGEVKPTRWPPLGRRRRGGAWSMQIASQPTEAAAQSTYQDLARRYGSVLGGRQASIVKAEISGKGTFWRVRVPAGSRNEAISLCERYKAAGGNCFVSK